MAELSNHLLLFAVLAYLASMVCHAAEYALGISGRVDWVEDRPEQDLVSALTTPHSPGSAVEIRDEESVAIPKEQAIYALRQDPWRWAGLAAVSFAVLGSVAHLGTVVTRGVAAGRLPWGNMYEFIVAAAFIGALAWLFTVVRRPNLRILGLFATLSLVLLLGAASMIAYTPVGPLAPALNSYWLTIHVTAAVVSSGIFLFGFVPAAMFLVRTGFDQGRRGFPFPLGRRMPTADVLERTSFRLHAFAFPIWTFAALIAGPIWAEASWGRYWGWDPKEVWAFISWVVYAGYLHARATPSVKRTTAMWIAVLGWLTMLMNLFGVNLFFSGFHSYSGIQ